MKVYFDNNIYNYLVDGKSIPNNDIKKLINAVKSRKVVVIFSPVNLFEIVRCFENKDEKAKKMIEISSTLSKKVAITSDNIFISQLNAHLNNLDFSNLSIYSSSETIFDKIRNGILENKSYCVPTEFHDEIKKYNSWYINSLNTMKDEINKFISEIQSNNSAEIDINTTPGNPIDLYNRFNDDQSGREMFLEAILRDRCHYGDDLSKIRSFDDIPSLSIFLKYYLKVAHELIIFDKQPKNGDWADLDQTVYFYYADYIVTSDTGKAGIFPNYRSILNNILQPMNKSAIRFSTLISKLDKLA